MHAQRLPRPVPAGSGAPVTPADLGIDDALADEGLRYCIYVRRRMTLLRLLLMRRPQV